MQRLEVSGAVRLIYRSLGVKGLRHCWTQCRRSFSVLPTQSGELKMRVGQCKNLQIKYVS